MKKYRFYIELKQKINWRLFIGRKNINENIDDLKTTRWIAEFLKNAIITIITSVFTIMILFFVRQFSSGNYEGVKLQKYIEKSILRYIDTTNIKSNILYNGECDLLSKSQTIFVYSKYTTLKSSTEEYNSVCLSIFEKKEKNIFHEILGIEPSYGLVFCCNIENAFMGLVYNDFSYQDLDNDGLIEFILYTNSFFATASSYESIIFSRNNGKWSIIMPNIEEIENSIESSMNCNCIIPYGYGLEDNFTKKSISSKSDILTLDASTIVLNDLLIPNKNYYILGLTGYGSVNYTHNPFNSNIEICYEFSFNYKDNPYYNYKDIRSKDFVYIMQQFSNKELFTDPNWNLGKPLFKDEKLNLDEEGFNYWGIQTENNIYFSIPDLKE